MFAAAATTPSATLAIRRTNTDGILDTLRGAHRRALLVVGAARAKGWVQRVTVHNKLIAMDPTT